MLAIHMAGFDVERRTMFGAPCYFVNGNMFAGVMADYVFLRLSPPDLQEMIKEGQGRPFEPVPGKKMLQYCAISGDLLKDELLMRKWLERGYAYVSGLEVKKRGRNKRSKPTKTWNP